MTTSKLSTAAKTGPVGGPAGREQAFWRRTGAVWRQLAGDFARQGFSFEWHEGSASSPIPWAESFHPHSVEICLNLLGTGWVRSSEEHMRFEPETAGFFALRGQALGGQRVPGQQHQFLSVEFSLPFLQTHLARHAEHLHPVIGQCLSKGPNGAGLSTVTPLTHRHRDLLNSLLHPPVLVSAQQLWYEVKALEFAAEFFFCAGESEPLCSRAQRLAAERVARAKAVLAENLAEPPSLEELGRQVACSPFYLSRTFSQETGLTISQWLRQARLERAAELLRSGQCNVTQAALEVGYASLSHFSQAFHERFGCCPGLYPLCLQGPAGPPFPQATDNKSQPTGSRAARHPLRWKA